MISSGLYKKLTSLGYLIPHTEVKTINPSKNGWKVIEPTKIPFISYPYEWSFSMLKDAALLTLQIQKLAIEHGMSLKDASAFNIQFFEGKPILIDTLSFEKYDEGKPWVAYKQFVEHFLSPLYLMAKVDIQLAKISSVFLDGVPLELTSHILPFKTRLNLHLLIHIHAHANTQKKYSDKKLGEKLNVKSFTKNSLLGLIDNLEGAVKRAKWSPKGTQWEDYYEEDKNNYNTTSLDSKGSLVDKYLKLVKPKIVWDMGANTGYFSRIAAKLGASVLSFDVDYGALEKNYHQVVKNNEKNILPLFSDLTNPTPAVGWINEERDSLFQRGPADAVLALALIHHLAISHNVPFDHLAACFAKMGNNLIIEFIEKEDSQIQILLANRKDIFTEYTKENFEKAFGEYFTIKQSQKIPQSLRTLYLMEKKK